MTAKTPFNPPKLSLTFSTPLRKSANPLAKAIGIGSIMFFPVDFLMSAKFAKDNVEFCKKNYFA